MRLVNVGDNSKLHHSLAMPDTADTPNGNLELHDTSIYVVHQMHFVAQISSSPKH